MTPRLHSARSVPEAPGRRPVTPSEAAADVTPSLTKPTSGSISGFPGATLTLGWGPGLFRLSQSDEKEGEEASTEKPSDHLWPLQASSGRRATLLAPPQAPPFPPFLCACAAAPAAPPLELAELAIPHSLHALPLYVRARARTSTRPPPAHALLPF